jgi:thiol:disulfide interchange protein DsbD
MNGWKLTLRMAWLALAALLGLGLGSPRAHAALGGINFAAASHTQASLIAESTAIAPGHPLWMAVRLQMDTSWHTYWVNPGEAGDPTKVDWELPPGWTAGPIQWPTPKRLPIGNLMNYGYEGIALLLFQLTPPANLPADAAVILHAKISWLECADICVPGSAEVSLTLPVASSEPPADTQNKPLIDAARAALPQPAEAFNVSAWRDGDKLFLGLEPKPGAKTLPTLPEVYFFSEDSQTQPSAPQTLHQTKNGWVLAMAGISSAPPDVKTLPGVLTLDGTGSTALALNPTLAATVPAAFADFSAGSPPSGLLAILILGFLGGLILNVMPCVFPVLGIKVLGFVKQAGAERRQVVLHGLVFTAGVLVSMWTLVGVLQSLRAAGAQLGWGFQLQEPAFVLGLAIFFLLFALSLSGVFEIGGSLIGAGSNLANKRGLGGSFFQGALAVVVATPCTAPLLAPALGAAFTLPPIEGFLAFTAIALGLASPYLVLSLFPGLARWLPRPGAWMETFKQFMAFPLYATVGFLLYTLAGQVSAERFLTILFALVAIAMAAWVYGRWATPSATPKGRRLATGVALLIFLPTAAWAFWPTQELNWEPWSAARVAELQKEGRPIYVDFTARWCATCQVNKEIVFHSSRVLAAIDSQHVALLRADWTARDPAITAELARFGRSAVPFDLIYLPGHDAPVELPAVLTPDIVLNALENPPAP